jgi:hypothetical protein
LKLSTILDLLLGLLTAGAAGSEGGYWQSVRDEEFAESRNAETGSSTIII